MKVGPVARRMEETLGSSESLVQGWGANEDDLHFVLHFIPIDLIRYTDLLSCPRISQNRHTMIWLEDLIELDFRIGFGF